MKSTILGTFCLLCSLSVFAELEITTTHHSERELKIKQSIESLIKRHDIKQWLYTSKIIINDNEEIPYSHPILTLTTKDEYLNDDINLLSTFLHEQFHWHLTLNNDLPFNEFTAIIKEQFPNVQKDLPFGSGNEMSTLSHLLVCYLEFKALTALIGEEKARNTLMQRAYYTWVYQTVLDSNNMNKLEGLLERFKLTISV